ncbi:MAG: PLDc N-terminal domain-containing protein [Cyclobacteriaceae bacterium]
MDWLIIGIVGASIAIYAMVDISMKSVSRKNRLIWFPIIIMIPIIGPLAYYYKRKSLIQA